MSRQLHFSLMFWATGTHPAGWRHPAAKADGAYDPEFIHRVTQLVERAKFDMLFLGDKLSTDTSLQSTNPAQMSRLEPFTIAASLAAVTERIGIVATANPTYYDPYTLARLTATLDHLSAGRAAWNLVTGADPHAAANYSRDAHWDSPRRYEWASECLDVVRRLWDSWPDEPFTAASDGTRSIAGGAPEPLRHRGPNFGVAGALNVPRPPQGQVVLLHAGTSEQSKELAAREADVVFTAQPTLQAAQEFYRAVKTRAAAYGRSGDEITIMPGLLPIVGRTTAEAVALFDELNELLLLDPERPADLGRELADSSVTHFRAAPQRNLATVSEFLGVDLTGNPLRAPVDPSVRDRTHDRGRALFDRITAVTRRTLDGPRRITHIDLIHHFAPSHALIVGDPVEVADHIERWFTERGADGFNVFPALVPGAVEAFVELVIPELQRRGLFRTEYEGATLRDHLGLARPERAVDAATAVRVAR